jgi:hypothetical protein
MSRFLGVTSTIPIRFMLKASRYETLQKRRRRGAAAYVG